MEPRRYQWDDAKRIENLEKHGIDFHAAFAFDWTSAIVQSDSRLDYGEKRFVAYGPVAGRLYVLVHTFRADATRIISLRKANRREQAAYNAAISARLARR